jgi:hypothetical protein
LEIVPTDEEPDDIMPAPQPVQILTLKPEEWSIATLGDIQRRLQTIIPGTHDPHSLQLIHDAVKSRKVFSEMVKKADKTVLPNQLEMLNKVIDLSSCKVLLDPFAGVGAVRKGLHLPPNSTLVLNDKNGHPGCHIHMEPLEPALYRRVIGTCGRLDAIVMCPPAPLAEFALCVALSFASKVVCMCVPESWVAGGWKLPRGAFLDRLCKAGQLVHVREGRSPFMSTEWLLFFPSSDMRRFLIHPSAVVDEECHLVVCHDIGK